MGNPEDTPAAAATGTGTGTGAGLGTGTGTGTVDVLTLRESKLTTTTGESTPSRFRPGLVTPRQAAAAAVAEEEEELTEAPAGPWPGYGVLMCVLVGL